MQPVEIVRELRGHAANLALRMPISWVNILAGPPAVIDGRTLDGRTQWFLKLLARSGQKPLHQLSVTEAREEFESFQIALSGRPATVGSIVDRTIAIAGKGSDNGSGDGSGNGSGVRLRVRCYKPFGVGPQPLPTVLYFHGGGWTIGSLEAYDAPLRFFCARIGCAVLAVDYRLAPEHKFPAAVDDAVATFHWLAANAAGLGLDPGRIVVAGDSAGGTLAAVVSQLTRGDVHRPCLQWLIYPCTDLGGSAPSHESCGTGFLLSREDMAWCRGHYLTDPAEEADPRASPLRQPDLSGQPPALIFTAGFDPLRDEGKQYADRLSQSGGKVVYREFDSLIHGFIGMRGALQAAARAMDDMVAGVRHELAGLGS
jgi:acetyl esterase